MNHLADAWAWILDPAHWAGPDGIPVRVGEHLAYTFAAVVLASLVAVPLGLLIGHTGRGRALAVGSSSAARAVPTLGLITLLALLWGVGLRAPMVAFVVLAIPSILAAAYAGVEAVDPQVRDAARAVGMTGPQVLGSVELPLALPMLWGGIRAGTLQVVATATLAAYVGSGGLGRYLFRGLKTQDYAQMLAAALLVVLLAILLEVVLGLAQRMVVPRGVREQFRR
ncbi:MAG: ABC transporter permease [Actinomycetales bacterium]|nr:ABC transporter permease [Actinomycetales bacterium]